MTLSFHFCWLCNAPLQFSDDNVTLIVYFYITLHPGMAIRGHEPRRQRRRWGLGVRRGLFSGQNGIFWLMLHIGGWSRNFNWGATSIAEPLSPLKLGSSDNPGKVLKSYTAVVFFRAFYTDKHGSCLQEMSYKLLFNWYNSLGSLVFN